MQRSPDEPIPQDSKKKESNSMPLHEPLVDLSIFDESNIEIDPHSLELLKKGDVEQRYAVVGYVKDKKLYLHFRPSFYEVKNSPPGITEEEKEKLLISQQPGAKKFKPENRVIAPPHGTTGVVHKSTNESVRERSKSLKTPLPGVESEIQIGLSFYKYSNDLNLLDWLSRSTRNWDIFRVNNLASVCFHFDSTQTTFVRPAYTSAFNLNRTLEQESFEKIIFAVRNKALQVRDSKELKSEHDKLLKQIRKDTMHPAFSEWEKIRDDKDKLAKLIMRTIYLASGMTGERDDYQGPNDAVIANAIEVAKEYKIPLNLNYIPENHQEYKLGQTALMQAVKANDPKSVDTLLLYDAKSTINIKDVNGNTALHLAILSENKEMAKKLILNSYIDINATNLAGFTAFNLALQTNKLDMFMDVQVLEKLIESKNYTALDQLILKSKIPIEDPIKLVLLVLRSRDETISDKIMKYLTEKEIDIPNEYLLNIFEKAILDSNKDVLDYLIERKANLNTAIKDGMLPIHLAIQNGDKEIIKFLLESKADINATNQDGMSPIHLAVQKSDKEILEFLLEEKANINAPNKDGMSPLHLTVENRDKKLMKVLIEKNADVDAKNSKGKTPISMAISETTITIVPLRKVLLPIADLVRKHQYDKIKKLIESYPNIFYMKDKNTEQGRTLLDYAVKSGHLDIVKLLINETKKSNSAHGERSNTIEHATRLAVKHSSKNDNQLEIAKFLINQSADEENIHPYQCAMRYRNEKINNLYINEKDKDGLTYIHYVIQKQDEDALEELIDNKANIDFNQYDADGMTPLHNAVKNNNLDLVKLLIKGKVDIDKPSANSETPLQFSKLYNNQKLIDYLIKKKATVQDEKKQNQNEENPQTTTFFKKNKDLIQKQLSLLIAYKGDDNKNEELNTKIKELQNVSEVFTKLQKNECTLDDAIGELETIIANLKNVSKMDTGGSTQGLFSRPEQPKSYTEGFVKDLLSNLKKEFQKPHDELDTPLRNEKKDKPAPGRSS